MYKIKLVKDLTEREQRFRRNAQTERQRKSRLKRKLNISADYQIDVSIVMGYFFG